MNQKTRMWIYTCIEDGSDWSLYFGSLAFLLYSVGLLSPEFLIMSIPLGLIAYTVNNIQLNSQDNRKAKSE